MNKAALLPFDMKKGDHKMQKIWHTKNLTGNLVLVLSIFLVIVLLEISVFNLRHWTTRFISHTANILHYELNLNEGIELTATGGFQPTDAGSELIVNNINHTIRTVFIRPDFGYSNMNAVSITIRYHDENNMMGHSTYIFNGYEPSYYIPIGAMGIVNNIAIIFSTPYVSVHEIILNKPLPWIFQWVRVLFLTLIVSIACLCKKYRFSDIMFNPQIVWQKRVDKSILFSFIIILLLVLIFSTHFGFIPGSNNELRWSPSIHGYHGINHRMAEALLMGQLHLDIEPHENLLNAMQPYSLTYRLEQGLHGYAPWDHVFFNGRFYSYFGIVPVLILFLPYYVLVGSHISATTATFIFSVIGVIGLYLLWKELTKKYLDNIPYSLYLAGLVGTLFGSNLMLLVVRAHQYETAIASGFMFSVWGLLLIFRATKDDSYDKIETKFLFWGGLFMALAVGCRPTMLLVSLIVPVILFPTLRSYLPINQIINDARIRKNLCKNVIVLAIPYLFVGVGLAWYNFARFGSIMEFGANYQLTAENVAVVTQSGLLGNLRRAFDGVISLLFASFTIRPRFPFVFTTYSVGLFTGHMPRQATIGAFMLPMTWFLFVILLIRKNDNIKRALHVIVSMVITSFLILTISAVMIGILSRYAADFFWLIVIPSLLCMGFLYQEAKKVGDGMATIVRRLSFIAIGLSCIILFGWGMTGEANYIGRHNPVVFRFLTDLFLIL